MKFTDEPNVAFPSYIFVRSFEGAEVLNYALAKAIREAATTPVADASGEVGGGFRSGDDFLEGTERSVVNLKAMINDACSSYSGQALGHVYEDVASLRGKVELVGWARILRGRQAVPAHAHEESLISGTYYVSLPKPVYEGEGPEGDLILVHPFADALPASPPLPFQTEMHIRVNAGMMFLHPGFMPHYVPAFEGGGERLSISFVLRPLGATGTPKPNPELKRKAGAPARRRKRPARAR